MAFQYSKSYEERDTFSSNEVSIPQDEKKARKIYSTAMINQLIKDRNAGYDIDYEPFYMKDLDLRSPNISFLMTDEEYEEYQKCYDDALYYVEKYCKFMTDNGMSLVELREFQKNVIKTVTDETYLEDLDLFGPKNRGVIWMSARQSGKCCLFDNELNIKYYSPKYNPENISISDLYFQYEKPSKLKLLFYKLYHKSKNIKFLKIFFGKIIQAIETKEFKGLELDQNDISKKVIKTYKTNNSIYVKCDYGYAPIKSIHKTQPYDVYTVHLENGKIFECADKHILYEWKSDGTVSEKFAKDFEYGNFLHTEVGPIKILWVEKMPYKMSMYDITVDSPEHRYYANGILSHNTTTVSAFLSWMLIFHADRNILVVANKEATAIEIVDKITNIFKGLPFFLKPGCNNFGKTGLRLENGSRILSSATTNTASIGFTIHCVLLDEFAHIPDNIVNNFWRSVYPTLSSSKISQCIITSTPNGTTNKFYELWSNAIEKKNSFIPIRTDYWEVPEHDDEWATQMRADFGDDEFAQEFELQFNINSRMILKGEDLKWLSFFKKEYVNKEIYSSDNPLLNDPHMKWHPDFDPNDISDNDKFIFIVDLAEGVADPDNKSFKKKNETPDSNSIQIFKLQLNSLANIRKYANKSCSFKDCYRFIQVGTYETNEEDEEYCGKVCAALAYDWLHDDDRENVKVMVEVNFNGKSFINAMGTHPAYYKGTILYTYHTKPVPGEVQRRRAGFKTKGDKEAFCMKGAKLISMRRIIPTDAATYNQMQSFGYVRGKLKGIACHDDLSMPVFNHISRMLDDDLFQTWLEECLEIDEHKEQVYKINNLIEAWALENPEMSDSEFDAMYSDTGLGGLEIVQNRNPYSVETSNNPYIGTATSGIGYSQMFPGSQNITYSSLLRR